MLTKIIEDMTTQILKQYKSTYVEIQSLIKESLETQMELAEKWEKAKSIKDVKRTSDYKNFYKKIKKNIYYKLRTYQTGSTGKTEESHISTGERTPYKEMFLGQIKEHVLGADTILDIGGGIFPITVPTDWYEHILRYVWIDKDRSSLAKLQDFARKQNLSKIETYCEEINPVSWHRYTKEKGSFDLAIMLKLVPVVKRQNKELLAFLSKVPAKKIIITGSKESMVKKVNITKREDRVLKSFIEMTGKKVVGAIDIPNEFGYILE